MSECFNPYAPPAETGARSDPSPPPGGETVIPRVFGVLSIVFSSVVIFILALGIVVGFIAHRMKSKAPDQVSAPAKGPVKIVAEVQGNAPAQAKTAKRVSAARPLQEAAGVVIGVAWLLGTPLLLLIGVGQLRYKRWARFASLAWSGAVLLALTAVVALVALSSAKQDELIALLFLNVFSSAYPMLLLIFFTRPRVALAMVR